MTSADAGRTGGEHAPPAWGAAAEPPRQAAVRFAPPSPRPQEAGTSAASARLGMHWHHVLTTLLAVLLLALAGHAFAVEPGERLANPKLEARAEAIGRTLRCLVCQNESIEESNASLAHDIRVLLRQLLLKGDTDAQARQAIVARYGEFVLLDPPVQPATYVLWYGPIVLLLGGFAGLVLWLRFRWRGAAATPPPLSAEEESRLDTLLHEADR